VSHFGSSGVKKNYLLQIDHWVQNSYFQHPLNVISGFAALFGPPNI
jgi:hypothetical protein